MSGYLENLGSWPDGKPKTRHTPIPSESDVSPPAEVCSCGCGCQPQDCPNR